MTEESDFLDNNISLLHRIYSNSIPWSTTLYIHTFSPSIVLEDCLEPHMRKGAVFHVTSHISWLEHINLLTCPQLSAPCLCPLLPSMPGRPKFKTKAHQAQLELEEKWMAWAVKLYLEEQKGDSEKKRGLWQECWSKTKVKINIQKSTLQRRIKGEKSQAQSNAEKGWLTDEEAAVVIAYAIKLADQGWPLSQQRLQEHAK